MGSFNDLTGRRFERLLVIRRVQNMGNANTKWLCKCDCGNESFVQGGALKDGRVRSCGCLHKETVTKHGMHKSKTYSSWSAMKDRCTNHNKKVFKYYGGRGISYCKEWENFETFLSDMGDKPEGTSLDRIDNNLGYSPENCKWSTHKEQLRNTRATTYLKFRGVKKSLQEWAEELEISSVTLKSRINRGWSIKDTLTRPVNKLMSHKRKHQNINNL